MPINTRKSKLTKPNAKQGDCTMNSHAEANYDSTASSPSPKTEVLGKAGNTPVAGSTSNELPQVSLPTDSAQGQPLSPADLVCEVMTDLMANDTFHEKMMAMITSMVHKVVDTTYQRLLNCSEENRGSIHELHVKLDEVQKDFTKLHKQVEAQQEQLKILKRANNDMEQYSRRNCIRVFGIEESRDENCEMIALDVFRNRLGLDVSSPDIDRCHRVGKVKPGYHRALIVKFLSYRVRSKTIKSRRRLKGSGISIQEDLTALNQDLYRKVYTSKKVTNSWTADGRIFVQVKASGGKLNTSIVSSEADLVRLNIL